MAFGFDTGQEDPLTVIDLGELPLSLINFGLGEVESEEEEEEVVAEKEALEMEPNMSQNLPSRVGTEFLSLSPSLGAPSTPPASVSTAVSAPFASPTSLSRFFLGPLLITM